MLEQAQPARCESIMQPAELSIIAPTFNERDNIAALVRAIADALPDIAWELIVVDDDSPDGTAELARQMAQNEPRLRCIRRIGRRGLSSAAIEGFASSSAPYLALIDADLQHDETRLPVMLEKLKKGEADLVVGSRYAEGGSARGLADNGRENLSLLGGALAKKVLRAQISDPMSGFFALRRDTFDKVAPCLSGQGFKILVDILASSKIPLRIAEVPFIFRKRHAGTSKLDAAAKFDYLLLLLDKTAGQIVPLRFLLFSFVGTLGLGVHLGALLLLYRLAGLDFPLAQGFAALVAMTTNFFLNNAITYRDRKLKGARFLLGLLSFYLVCGIGLFANVGVATALYNIQQRWWLAGLFGGLVSAVWNYAASNALTWKGHR